MLSSLYEKGLKSSPDKAALIFKDKYLCYSEFDNLVNKSANALYSLGIRRGDRVALYLYNCLELIVLYHTCFKIGAVSVPINDRYQKDEILYVLGECSPRLFISSDNLIDKVSDLDKSDNSIEKVFSLNGSESSNIESWNRFVENLRVETDYPSPKPDDAAMILFTSGSTDKPKGVTHTQQTLYNSSKSRAITQKLTDEDIGLVGTAACHVGGSIGMTFPLLYVGGTVVILEHFNPESYIDCLKTHRPTRSLLLPAQLLDVVEHPDAKGVDFTCLKEMECGGDTVSHDLYDHFYKVAGFDINQLYGLTECEGCCINPPFGEIRRGSIGKTVYGVEFKLVDHNLEEVEVGKIGEILIKSDKTMVGYWNDPENTERTLMNGWLRTGDLARRDEEGYYYFIGRSKEVIIKGGSNIAPGEVEDVLDDHPLVIISGVVGFPDPHYGNLVHAFIELDSSAEEPPSIDELFNYTSQKIATYKVPDKWTFVDKLPRNEVGKIDRKGLHRLAIELDS